MQPFRNNKKNTMKTKQNKTKQKKTKRIYIYYSVSAITHLPWMFLFSNLLLTDIQFFNASNYKPPGMFLS